MRLVKSAIRRTLKSIGLTLVRSSNIEVPYRFSGTYIDPSTETPTIQCDPGDPKSYAEKPVIFNIDNGHTILHQEVLYSSLTLLKMLKHYQFDSVLDVGSHAGNVARVFAHMGKKVTTCEISPGYEADYKDDFLEIEFPKQFDAIWCSQILEHQRNIGVFLNKVFDDLRENGVLALTVPADHGPHLSFGHCNQFNPMLVIYHLVMAGFDCSEISICRYDSDIGVVLRKTNNGIDRNLPQGTLPVTEATSGEGTIDGKTWDIRALLGNEVFEGMQDAFPPHLALEHGGNILRESAVNWGKPI